VIVYSYTYSVISEVFLLGESNLSVKKRMYYCWLLVADKFVLFSYASFSKLLFLASSLLNQHVTCKPTAACCVPTLRDQSFMRYMILMHNELDFFVCLFWHVFLCSYLLFPLSFASHVMLGSLLLL
jgi:hypothetical protein